MKLSVLLCVAPTCFRHVVSSAVGRVRQRCGVFSAVCNRRTGGDGISVVNRSLKSTVLTSFLAIIIASRSPDAVRGKTHRVYGRLKFIMSQFFTIKSPVTVFFLLGRLEPMGYVPGVCSLGLLRSPIISRTSLTETRRGALVPRPRGDYMLEPESFIFTYQRFCGVFRPFSPDAVVRPLFFALF